jgi:hypothetical protein
MGSGLTSQQRAAFDDLLFDQMASLMYTHKALSAMNPCFREESVLPLLLQVRTAVCVFVRSAVLAAACCTALLSTTAPVTL